MIGHITTHPWNTSFQWEMPPGPYRALTDEQAAHFDEQGYVVLEDVLPLDLVAPVRDELDGFEAKTEAWLKQQKKERAAISEAGAITFTTSVRMNRTRPAMNSAEEWLCVLAASPNSLAITDAKL